MCGFAGFVDFRKEIEAPERLLRDMGGTLVHRGPDDEGVWFDRTSGVGFAHRRLSIVDLSPEGHQPMTSSCGRYVIAYNGEIYNFQQLRHELDVEGAEIAWRGSSDTEVALQAISQWGLTESLRKFNGMFAFSLWDKRERLLHFARDRFGEKPLYYTVAGNHLLFGSELKSLRVHPRFQGNISRNALALFMRYCYVPAPYSIYEGVWKLMPASYMTVSAEDWQNGEFHPKAQQTYWSMRGIAETGTRNPLDCSVDDALDQLDALLKNAVGMRMTADVPLGAFLSGGIDSSTVVAMMQSQSDRPVRTFSIGSYVDDYNEAPFAQEVAKCLGTEHTELYVTPEETLNLVLELPNIYDEPFADSSQVPTTLLSHLTRKHVTVSLSGDGGDEPFGGYNRHFLGSNIWRRAEKLPRPARRVIGRMLGAIPPGAVDRVHSIASRLLPLSILRQGAPGRAIEKVGSIIAADTPEAMYQSLVSTWPDPAALVRGASEPITDVMNPDCWPDLSNITDRMMYMDIISYLPDDILTKVDRASMNASLETRVPFLDPDLIEFAWRIPLDWKIREDEGKWILRQLLYRYVPRELVERPKKGFGVPVGEWLRGPLRDWAESLIDERRLADEGFLHTNLVRRCWDQHTSGKRFSPARLWNVLMFQAWLEASQ